MFACLKFIKPLWYFHLKCGENVIWSDPNYVNPKLLLDSEYETFQSMVSEASYLALMNGYDLTNPDKVCLPKEIVEYKHSPYDEFRFIRKFFNPMWSVGYLLYRIITLKSIFKSIIAFFNTFFCKRVSINQSSSLKKLRPSKHNKLFLKRIPVRIIIPTYNRYGVLYNLLRDLENQTYLDFRVTIVDQSEKFNKEFYENFNMQIDLVRQEIPGLWRARNNAIKNTNEKIIALLDDDSRINKNWLIKHLNCMEYFSAEISAGVSLSEKGAKIPFNYSFYRISDQLDTGNVVLYRSIFKICGLFDERFENMRMGDAEFGLRAFKKGIISVSNPEAYRAHLKSNEGGLRDKGSWDAFRPVNLLEPRPVPSVLYYARKNFGFQHTLIFLFISLPLSFSKYSKKTEYSYLILSSIIFMLLIPIVFITTFRSWKISSSILSLEHEIPHEK